MEKENSYKDAAQHYEQVFEIYTLCMKARNIHGCVHEIIKQFLFV